MAEKLIFSDKEVRFLSELVRNKVDFMIVGLSAAALQGAPVVTQDVDLWFKNLDDPGIRRALKKVGGSFIPSIAMHPPMFEGAAVDLFAIVVHMHGLDAFSREKRHCILVPLGRIKVAVLALKRIIKSKQATGRPKDKLALPVLSDALRILRGGQITESETAGTKRQRRA